MMKDMCFNNKFDIHSDVFDPKGIKFPINGVPVYYNQEKVGIAKLTDNNDATGYHTKIQFDKGKIPLELLNNKSIGYGLGYSITGDEIKLNEVSIIKK